MKNKKHIHSIDYYAYRSPMRNWNPKLKVITALFILCLCLLENKLFVSVYIVVTLGIANIKMNRISLQSYIALMAVPLFFLIMGSAAIAIEVGVGETGWYLRMTRESLMESSSVMMRAFGAVSALYFLTLSTPVSEIIGVLKYFHVPGVMVELMYLIYRYIFILLDARQKAADAAQSRLGNVDFKTSCKTFGSSMGNLLAVSLKKSNLYYDAMVSRGYDGGLTFLEEERPVKAGSFIMAGLYFISILLIGQFI